MSSLHIDLRFPKKEEKEKEKRSRLSNIANLIHVDRSG